MNKVYGVALSPYVRKVLFALEHKDVAYEIETVLPFKVANDYLEKSPLGKVPCFEDEYITLPDSSVICAYIDNKYPVKSFYPRDFRERAKAQWLEKYADTQLADVTLTYYFQNFVKPVVLKKSSDEALIRAVQQKKEPETLAYLERTLPSSGFLFSDGLMLADVSIVGMLVTGSYAGMTICPVHYPKITAYVDRVSQTAEMQKRLAEEKALLDMFRPK